MPKSNETATDAAYLRQQADQANKNGDDAALEQHLEALLALAEKSEYSEILLELCDVKAQNGKRLEALFIQSMLEDADATIIQIKNQQISDATRQLLDRVKMLRTQGKVELANKIETIASEVIEHHMEHTQRKKILKKTKYKHADTEENTTIFLGKIIFLIDQNKSDPSHKLEKALGNINISNPVGLEKAIGAQFNQKIAVMKKEIIASPTKQTEDLHLFFKMEAWSENIPKFVAEVLINDEGEWNEALLQEMINNIGRKRKDPISKGFTISLRDILKKYKQDESLREAILNIKASEVDQDFVRGMLGLPADHHLTDVDCRRAVLHATMYEWRQRPNVYNCFASSFLSQLLKNNTGSVIQNLQEIMTNGTLTKMSNKGPITIPAFQHAVHDKVLQDMNIHEKDGELSLSVKPFTKGKPKEFSLDDFLVDPAVSRALDSLGLPQSHRKPHVIQALKTIQTELESSDTKHFNMLQLFNTLSQQQELIDKNEQCVEQAVFAYECHRQPGLLQVFENALANMSYNPGANADFERTLMNSITDQVWVILDEMDDIEDKSALDEIYNALGRDFGPNNMRFLYEPFTGSDPDNTKHLGWYLYVKDNAASDKDWKRINTPEKFKAWVVEKLQTWANENEEYKDILDLILNSEEIIEQLIVKIASGYMPSSAGSKAFGNADITKLTNWQEHDFTPWLCKPGGGSLTTMHHLYWNSQKGYSVDIIEKNTEEQFEEIFDYAAALREKANTHDKELSANVIRSFHVFRLLANHPSFIKRFDQDLSAKAWIKKYKAQSKAALQRPLTKEEINTLQRWTFWRNEILKNASEKEKKDFYKKVNEILESGKDIQQVYKELFSLSKKYNHELTDDPNDELFNKFRTGLLFPLQSYISAQQITMYDITYQTLQGQTRFSGYIYDPLTNTIIATDSNRMNKKKTQVEPPINIYVRKSQKEKILLKSLDDMNDFDFYSPHGLTKEERAQKKERRKVPKFEQKVQAQWANMLLQTEKSRQFKDIHIKALAVMQETLDLSRFTGSEDWIEYKNEVENKLKIRLDALNEALGNLPERQDKMDLLTKRVEKLDKALNALAKNEKFKEAIQPLIDEVKGWDLKVEFVDEQAFQDWVFILETALDAHDTKIKPFQEMQQLQHVLEIQKGRLETIKAQVEERAGENPHLLQSIEEKIDAIDQYLDAAHPDDFQQLGSCAFLPPDELIAENKAMIEAINKMALESEHINVLKDESKKLKEFIQSHPEAIDELSRNELNKPVKKELVELNDKLIQDLHGYVKKRQHRRLNKARRHIRSFIGLVDQKKKVEIAEAALHILEKMKGNPDPDTIQYVLNVIIEANRIEHEKARIKPKPGLLNKIATKHAASLNKLLKKRPKARLH